MGSVFWITSSKKKGQNKELRCQKALEAEGWTVGFRSMTVKFGPIYKGLDLFDLFDLLAVRQEPMRGFEVPAPHWLFVSVKTYGPGHGRFAEHQRLIQKFKEDYALHNMTFELWLYHKPGYEGRGKKRAYQNGGFERIPL
jgi:hypothetical protein